MQLGEVTSYNLRSKTILAEGWQDLNEAQRIYVGKWERNVWPLVESINHIFEQTLDAKQIDGIFTNAEKVAIDSGDNKTALGKAGQVVGAQAKKLQDQIDQLLKAAQDSGPVKNFDAQFEKLKANLKTKLEGNPMGQKIMTMVDGYADFAKGNPAKAAFVIGAMTSVLAFASGGIVSGAAIGFFLRLANNTLKGDKLSTAVGKGIKGAAIGALAGALGDALGDAEASEMIDGVSTDDAAEVSASVDSEEVKAAMDADVDADGGGETPVLPDIDEYKTEYIRSMLDSAKFAKYDFTEEMIEKMADNVEIDGTYPDNFRANFGGSIIKGNIYLDPEEAREFQAFMKTQPGSDMEKFFSKETDQWLKDNVEGAQGRFDAADAAKAARDAEIAADQVLDADEVKGMSDADIQARIKEINNSTNPVTGGKIDPEGNSKLARELRQLQRELNDREMDNFSGATLDPTGLIQEYTDYLDDTMVEGPVLDKMKALAKSGAVAVGKTMDKAGEKVAGGISKAAGAVKGAGKQLGNKITKEKLMKTWTKMGKPTDMGSIANILSDAGLSDESIGTVSANTKIPLKPTAKPDAGEEDPKAPTPGGATAKPGATPTDTDAVAKGVDANKDGKDDKTGKVIQMPGTKPADGVDAPKSGIGKAIGDKQPKVPGTAGKTAIGDKQPKVPGTAKSQKATAPGMDVDVPGLADQIKKAGLGDQIKTQLSQPAKAGGSAGSGSDLGSGMQIDLPTLASQISDAGLQNAVKAQLTQKQTA